MPSTKRSSKLPPPDSPAIKPWRPTRLQLEAARDKTVPDLVAPALRVLFAGINPGLYTAAIQRHFGRPGNRFWPALHAGGFTPRLFSPFESDRLLGLGLGITNLVNRATATADELSRDELVRGGRRLVRLVRRVRPGFVAIVGLTAYRMAFDRPRAALGRQDEPLAGATLWVLPNPSGLNAHYQPRDLASLFRQLAVAAGVSNGGGRT